MVRPVYFCSLFLAFIEPWAANFLALLRNKAFASLPGVFNSCLSEASSSSEVGFVLPLFSKGLP